MHVSSRDPSVRPILAATFPQYGRPSVAVKPFPGSMTLNSYWDGGSKDEYCFFHLGTGKTFEVPASHPYFDRKPNGERMGVLEVKQLPEQVVLVQGGTFCGKTASVTIYANPDDLALAIEDDSTSAELSDEEKAALSVVAGIKGGKYRAEEFERKGLGEYGPKNRWVVMLRARDLVKVNKAGAVSVTLAGRNAYEKVRGW